MQRILGVDVGLKRVGIAQSDLTGILASPLGTFSYDDAILRIAGMCDKGEVQLIVVGWPLTLRGEEGDSVDMVRKFLTRLEKVTGGVPIKTLDERFTSTIARQSIRDSGARQKKRRKKELIDSTAATILLQNYLDSK
jgi:putative holliday junction resolvase